MRMMIKDIVTKAGHTVIAEAADGKQAVQLYQQFHPDVVTMDITMPEMQGTEAVKEIRAQDPKAKIIMCSAMGQQAMVVEAIQAGAISFIVKPFQQDKVIDEVEKALAKAS